MTNREAKVMRSRYRNLVKNKDPELGPVEDWMKQMGVEFVDVWFFIRRTNEWWKEAQVDDHETFLSTVEMTASRHGARHALWHDGEQWCLLAFKTGETKRYPSREAAEMVAIHVR